MNFMVAQGYLGAGKTLGAVIFAMNYVQQSNCAIYANFGLRGAKPFSSIEDFKHIAMEHSSILIIDEGHMDMDARSFSSNHVKFFTQLAYYLRKLRCTLIVTSPSFGDLDSRIRGVTNILLNVVKDSNYFYYDVWDIQSREFKETIKIKRENAYAIADLYFDTNKMVTPIQVPNKKEDFTEFLEELKVIAESYHAGRMGAALPSPVALEGTTLVSV